MGRETCVAIALNGRPALRGRNGQLRGFHDQGTRQRRRSIRPPTSTLSAACLVARRRDARRANSLRWTGNVRHGSQPFQADGLPYKGHHRRFSTASALNVRKKLVVDAPAPSLKKAPVSKPVEPKAMSHLQVIEKRKELMQAEEKRKREAQLAEEKRMRAEQLAEERRRIAAEIKEKRRIHEETLSWKLGIIEEAMVNLRTSAKLTLEEFWELKSDALADVQIIINAIIPRIENDMADVDAELQDIENIKKARLEEMARFRQAKMDEIFQVVSGPFELLREICRESHPYVARQLSLLKEEAQPLEERYAAWRRMETERLRKEAAERRARELEAARVDKERRLAMEAQKNLAALQDTVRAFGERLTVCGKALDQSITLSMRRSELKDREHMKRELKRLGTNAEHALDRFMVTLGQLGASIEFPKKAVGFTTGSLFAHQVVVSEVQKLQEEITGSGEEFGAWYRDVLYFDQIALEENDRRFVPSTSVGSRLTNDAASAAYDELALDQEESQELMAQDREVSEEYRNVQNASVAFVHACDDAADIAVDLASMWKEKLRSRTAVTRRAAMDARRIVWDRHAEELHRHAREISRDAHKFRQTLRDSFVPRYAKDVKAAQRPIKLLRLYLYELQGHREAIARPLPRLASSPSMSTQSVMVDRKLMAKLDSCIERVENILWNCDSIAATATGFSDYALLKAKTADLAGMYSFILSLPVVQVKRTFAAVVMDLMEIKVLAGRSKNRGKFFYEILNWYSKIKVFWAPTRSTSNGFDPSPFVLADTRPLAAYLTQAEQVLDDVAQRRAANAGFSAADKQSIREVVKLLKFKYLASIGGRPMTRGFAARLNTLNSAGALSQAPTLANQSDALQDSRYSQAPVTLQQHTLRLWQNLGRPITRIPDSNASMPSGSDHLLDWTLRSSSSTPLKPILSAAMDSQSFGQLVDEDDLFTIDSAAKPKSVHKQDRRKQTSHSGAVDLGPKDRRRSSIGQAQALSKGDASKSDVIDAKEAAKANAHASIDHSRDQKSARGSSSSELDAEGTSTTVPTRASRRDRLRSESRRGRRVAKENPALTMHPGKDAEVMSSAAEDVSVSAGLGRSQTLVVDSPPGAGSRRMILPDDPGIPLSPTTKHVRPSKNEGVKRERRDQAFDAKRTPSTAVSRRRRAREAIGPPKSIEVSPFTRHIDDEDGFDFSPMGSGAHRVPGEGHEEAAFDFSPMGSGASKVTSEDDNLAAFVPLDAVPQSRSAVPSSTRTEDGNFAAFIPLDAVPESQSAISSRTGTTAPLVARSSSAQARSIQRPGSRSPTRRVRRAAGLKLNPTKARRAAATTPLQAPMHEEDLEIDDEASEESDSLEPLTYQIPEDLMATALQADGSAKWWSYQKYRSPDGSDVKLHYCTKKELTEREVQRFVGEPVLGCDIEWKYPPSKHDDFKQHVSVIQLASESRIGLFHIALHKGNTAEEVLAPTLKKILESPDVLKCGVNIGADFKRMQKWLGVDIVSLFELSHLHKLVEYGATQPKLVNRKLVSLATQTQHHLGLPLFKGDTRTSDWSKALNEKQCKYAGDDAYASFRLFHALKAKWHALDPRPPFPACAELQLPIQLAPLPESETEDDSSMSESPEEEDEEGDEIAQELSKLSLEERETDSSEDDFGENIFENLTPEELRALETHGTVSNDKSSNGEEMSPPRRIQYPTLPREFTIGDGPHSSFVARLRIPPRIGGLGLHNAGQQQDPRATPEIDSVPVPATQISIDSSTTSNDQPSTAPDAANQNLAIEATLWAEEAKTTRAAHKSGSLSIAALRAYYLWHHAALDVAGAANMLRDPPLKTATVAAYIAECVQFGNMEYGGVEKLRGLVKALPPQAKGRYWRIRKIVEEEE